MDFKKQYENAKRKIAADKAICSANKKWIREVLAYQELKGKRKNGLPALDSSCYKTLLTYTQKLKKVCEWFNQKPIEAITEKDFQKVYADLEEGRITKKNGKIYEDRTNYYSKIFKSKPFEMIGKDTIAKKIIKYTVTKDKRVRFIQDFKPALKQLVQNAISQKHKLLIQLLGDYGENIFSILQIKKKDFEKIIDKETGEPSYLINLHKSILKRSRTPRREFNIFPETFEMLEIYLEDLKTEDNLFDFGLRQSEIMFKRCVEKSKVKLQNGETPTLKDLRSSMACFLLNEGWTTDEIKSRLGHRPSSNVLDCYVSYLALNKNKVKKKMDLGNIKKLQDDLEKMKEQNKLKDMRINDLYKQLNLIHEQMNMRTEELFNKPHIGVKKFS